jgi:F0F1-type ATP synthase assembly protein I
LLKTRNKPYTNTLAAITTKIRMNKKQLNELTDEELLKKAEKIKSTQIIDATLIGVLIGILIYSITAGNFSYFFGIILLYAIYKLANKDKYKKSEIESLLKKRKLK